MSDGGLTFGDVDENAGLRDTATPTLSLPQVGLTSNKLAKAFLSLSRGREISLGTCNQVREDVQGLVDTVVR